MTKKEKEPIYSPDWPLPHRLIWDEWYKQEEAKEKESKNET